MTHNHDDERLTFGCPACIQQCRRIEQIAEEAEWRKKPWLAPDEWREKEADRLEHEADEILSQAEWEANARRDEAEHIRRADNEAERRQRHIPGQMSLA